MTAPLDEMWQTYLAEAQTLAGGEYATPVAEHAFYSGAAAAVYLLRRQGVSPVSCLDALSEAVSLHHLAAKHGFPVSDYDEANFDPSEATCEAEPDTSGDTDDCNVDRRLRETKRAVRLAWASLELAHDMWLNLTYMPQAYPAIRATLMSVLQLTAGHMAAAEDWMPTKEQVQDEYEAGTDTTED